MLHRKRKNPNNKTVLNSIEKEFKVLCKSRIQKLWNLLEIDNVTGERRPITQRQLQKEILPVCTTNKDTRLITAWIQELELQAASMGRETPLPIGRKTFHSRLHKDMFAPLLLGVVKESEIAGLTSTFEAVICSVERNRRWSKLKDRFASKAEEPKKRHDTVPRFMQQQETHRSLASSSRTTSRSHESDEGKAAAPGAATAPSAGAAPGAGAAKKSSRRSFPRSPPPHSMQQSSSSPASLSSDKVFQLRRGGWSDLTDWKRLRHHRRELHKKADHMNSLVRVWSYDHTVKRARTVTSHNGDHIQRASVQGGKLVVLLSNGKVEESAIHLTLLSKKKISELKRRPGLRRYNSMQTGMLTEDDDGKHHQQHQQHHRSLTRAHASSSNVLAANHEHAVHLSPSGHTMSPDQKQRRRLLGKQYPERNGLGIQIGNLWKYDVADVSMSDTQAVMVVEGKLYTWGHNSTVLGHPALPEQNASMQTPDVQDVVKGSTNPEDYLQRNVFEQNLSKFRQYHEDACNQAGLAKEGFDATWLEFPQDAAALWNKLQVEWHRQLNIAGPRLVKSAVARHYTDIRAVACGTSHTLAVTKHGTLIVWGINHHGCLGLGDHVPNGAMQQLPIHVTIDDGEVVEGEMKKNEKNRENNGTETKTAHSHHSHCARYDVAQIAAGGAHSAMLLRGGSLYTWGSGHFGQLGHRDFQDVYRPKKVSLAPDSVYKSPTREKKKVVANKRGYVSRKEKLALERAAKRVKEEEEKTGWKDIPFVSVSLGSDHTLGLTESGKVYSWGGNWRGQLGRITKMKHSGEGSNWKQHLVINAMRANWSVTRVASKIALKARSKTKMRDCYPKQVALEQLEKDSEGNGVSGSSVSYGSYSFNTAAVVSISAHGHASAALLDDGTVYTWGRVAVPKHAIINTKENVGQDQGHEGVLADRSLPVRNNLLKLNHHGSGHHAIEVSVTESAVVVVFDRVNHKRVEQLRLHKEREAEARRKFLERREQRGKKK